MDTRIKKVLGKDGKVAGYRIRPYANGRQICETLSTYKAAERRLREIQDQADKGTFIERGKIPTIQEVCYGEGKWLECKKTKAKKGKNNVMRRETTIAFYENQLKNYIVKDLGDIRMDRLTEDIFNAVMKEWAAKTEEDAQFDLQMGNQ